MLSEPLLLFRIAQRGLDRAELLQFARLLQGRVAGGGAFTCLVTDDREVRRLNLQFLGRNYATDVLSFPSARVKGMAEAGLGEMAISAETASKQARDYGHSVEHEIGILMLHGLLHLLGMDHERDRGRMARAEINWRKNLRLPAGLLERVRT